MSAQTFKKYSAYYDLLYSDKDYRREVEFVSALLEQHGGTCRRICEMGSGTGLHAELLARNGYTVDGIELSAEMLDVARARIDKLPPGIGKRLNFMQGDARTFKAGPVFDAALALFHVVSYQTTNADLIAMFCNISEQLRPGGIFIFDYWYGPAVLTERPSVRIKRMETDEYSVTRLAEPNLDVVTSQVEVNYDIFVRHKQSDATEQFRETHPMRYLFTSEIDLLARMSGMKVVDSCEWLTGKKPGSDTWGVCSILRK